MSKPLKIPDNWTFKSDEVACKFNDHVREQLPWYELATGYLAHIARHYIPQDGVVIDLGASTGNVEHAIADTLKDRNAKLIAVDNSPEMAKLYSGNGEFVLADIEDYDPEPFDVAVCFLTLMFVKPSKRKMVVERLKERMNDGGALIIVDRMKPVSGYPSLVMSRLTLAEKLRVGASPDNILRKEMSLIGVQRPIDSELVSGGHEVFRFGEFAGFILEKNNG